MPLFLPSMRPLLAAPNAGEMKPFLHMEKPRECKRNADRSQFDLTALPNQIQLHTHILCAQKQNVWVGQGGVPGMAPGAWLLRLAFCLPRPSA